MKKENIEIMIEQLESIENSFNDLEDCFYQMRRCFQDELKEKEQEKQ